TAELKNRKSQGHCFVNLGYAYSQLKDLNKAGESFLHAVQAAKDCGDKKSEWQSFEALGSVAYSLGDLQRAKEYYKQSLSSFGNSPDLTADKDVQDRILTKLTQVIQIQAKKSMVSPGSRQAPSPLREQTLELSSAPRAPNIDEAQSTTEIPASTTEGKDQRVIAIRRGSKIKHLKIRRSGTLRQFKKFALGLDVTRPNTAELVAMAPIDNVSILSAETILEHEIDEEDAEEDCTGSDDSESEASNRSVPKQAKEQDDIEVDEDSDDSGDDIRKVQAEMKKVASLNENDMPGTSGFVKETVSADVHAKAEDMESDSEEDSDESDETDSDEEINSKPQKKSLAPPLPSLSPPATKERTYEKPLQNEPLYETIDHNSKSRRKTEGEDTPSQRRASDGDGLNFFHADKMEHKKRLELAPGASARSKDKRPASGIFSDTLYETIGSHAQSRQGQHSLGDSQDIPIPNSALPKKGSYMPGGTESIQEEDEEEDSIQEMSRAQRDVLMFNEFKKDAANQEKSRPSEEPKDGDQKNSKHCIVM
ncbi:hypothetical protein EGW08_020457, partial [Elysia chlorotica]